VETLPPPPPEPADADADAPAARPERPHHVTRAGELTVGWRILTGIGWMGIVAVFAATWNVSRQLGLSTWWLGPVDNQRPEYVMMLPFVAPAVVLSGAANRVRYVPWIGVLGAAGTAAVGLGDLGKVTGIGVVELMAAAAALLISIASFSGMYRRADGSVDDESTSESESAEGDLDDESTDHDSSADDAHAPLPAAEPAPG
jgi:hypothetical protein